ncbi:MAG: tape measure protein [Bacteroidales bacterium]|nr:tape measure protein [Bacteroidales bacterium]
MAQEVKVTVNADTSKYERAMRNVKYTNQRTTKAMSQSWSSLSGTIAGVITGLGTAKLAQSFLQTGIESDRLTRSLSAAVGGMEEAAAAQIFLQKQSGRLGLVFQDQIESYKQLAASMSGSKMSGQDLTNIYLGIAEAATALQVPQEKTNLMFLAVSQMVSKGVVSMEELRQQLGENLPGALRIAAKSMGMMDRDFIKLVSSGKLMSDVFLPRFAKALREQYAGALETSAQSAQANINRMKNTWFDFKRTNMDAGVTFSISKAIADINDKFKAWMKTNDSMLRQKVPEYLEMIKVKINDLIGLFNKLPEGIVGVAGFGVIGRILFGGPKGALFGIMFKVGELIGKAINEAMEGPKTQMEALNKQKEKLERKIDLAKSVSMIAFYREQLGTVLQKMYLINSEKEKMEAPVTPKETLPTAESGTAGGMPDWVNPLGGGANDKKKASYRDIGPGLWESQASEKYAALSRYYEMETQLEEERMERLAATSTREGEIMQEGWGAQELAGWEHMVRMADTETRLAEQVQAAEEYKTRVREQAFSASQAIGNAAMAWGGKLGEKIFLVMKGVEIAKATMSAFSAANQALASPPGPPSTVPLAAAVLAYGLANVASIAATAIGQTKSGSVSSGNISYTSDLSTGLGATTTDAAETTGSLTINIQGDYIGDEGYVEMLAEKISEAVEDKNVRLVASNAQYAEALS